MPVALSYPGVYVQEIPSGVRTIVGVSTSIALFIGRTKSGVPNSPVLCLNYEDFVREFTADYEGGDLARAVRLFFANGGAQCYVMRITDAAAAPAALRLMSEGAAPALDVAARSPGLLGNDIRISVDYNTMRPEASFNLQVFRWVKQSNGTLSKNGLENFANLSMEPTSSRYVEDVVNRDSKQIRVTDPNKAVALAAGTQGYSLSGFALAGSNAADNNATLRAEIVAMLARGTSFLINIDGSGPNLVNLTGLVVPAAGAGFRAAFETALENFINPQLPPGKVVDVSLESGPVGTAGGANETTRLLRLGSLNGDVYIDPAPNNDLASAWMLGTAQGGIEVSRYAARRPAPNGVLTRMNNLTVAGNDFVSFGGVLQNAFNQIEVDGRLIDLLGPNAMSSTPAASDPAAHLFQDASATNLLDGRGGVREKLARIAAAVADYRNNNPDFNWTAEVWGSRLALIPAGNAADLATSNLRAMNAGAPVAAVFQAPIRNVRYFVLAAVPAGNFYALGASGNPGGVPQPNDYAAAYPIIDREVDLFNLMILPANEGQTDSDQAKLIGPASVFCQQRRAFLLVDPPPSWTGAQAATSPTGGVDKLRSSSGIVKDYSGVFYPNVKVDDAGKDVIVGPAGAIAGLMARIDSSRGVWKAAAGIEADLRGVLGVQYRFSDSENGVMNPKAINTIRVFPNGIVSWGARTLAGDDSFASEYKYIPIRRLALYIEESLYRGMKWAVFEPNDEPLWAQIRANVGAFMHNLFRQGAFQGATSREAYFVKCDASTTTQNDRDLGIVNVLVGFTPLKPAEFIVLSLQQIAGQIQV